MRKLLFYGLFMQASSTSLEKILIPSENVLPLSGGSVISIIPLKISFFFMFVIRLLCR